MAVTRRHLLTALPIAGSAALGFGFWEMLKGMKSGSFDPHAVSTPLLGKDIPKFQALDGLANLREGFSSDILQSQTQPILVNFMASWCVPCVLEMPFLKKISSQIIIWGVVYKDKAERAAAFIQRNGDPYQRIGQDPSGLTAINWGVTGVPESFLILPGGKIAWHDSAALDEKIFQENIHPFLGRTYSDHK
ncbi:redoxin family protein [Aristophania vespae]|uniref:redoxin family protein n=1 Tax=Aristophania vespae TaxID=2697033 RepID=UPI00235112CF|nr:redoxin family protein [Aristophania vespae]UMM64459.1 Thiol:disulfide interchange protein DsbE [Aristophania vespae]